MIDSISMLLPQKSQRWSSHSNIFSNLVIICYLQRLITIQIMLKSKLRGNPFRAGTTQSARTNKLEQLRNVEKKPAPNISFSTRKKNINIKCMNDEIFYQRRQNHLNSQYNRRKATLMQITKDNKKIFERINSQKSLYAENKMRKSYQSLKSLSRCSSRSKKSSESNRGMREQKRQRKQQSSMTIQSENINKIKETGINQFKSVFMREKFSQQNAKVYLNRPMGLTSRPNHRSFSLKQESVEKKPSTAGDMNGLMGGMLHRIAEDMLEGTKITKIGKRRFLY